MKEELIKLLGLKAEATDADVIAGVKALQREAALDASEAEIRKLMAESGGALSRDAAKQVLADRATHAENLKKQKKADKK